MKNIFKIVAGLTAALMIQGCAPSKSLNVTSTRDPLPDDCQATVYTPETNKPDDYEILATVKFGEAGLSLSCDEKSIKEAMRVEACKVGANGIIIVKEKWPSLVSDCYRATADLVYIGGNP